MKKNIILCAFLLLSCSSSFAKDAPIPKCSCNDISNQINLEKKAELKLEDEAKQIDYDVQNVENNIDEKIEKTINKTNSKRPWWRFGR